MTLRALLKIWFLYLALDLYCHFCVGCCLLGYRVIHLCILYLVSPPLSPDYDGLLELQEEVRDMDRQQRQLEAKLASLPEDPLSPDSPSSDAYGPSSGSDSNL